MKSSHNHITLMRNCLEPLGHYTSVPSHVTWPSGPTTGLSGKYARKYMPNLLRIIDSNSSPLHITTDDNAFIRISGSYSFLSVLFSMIPHMIYTASKAIVQV